MIHNDEILSLRVFFLQLVEYRKMKVRIIIEYSEQIVNISRNYFQFLCIHYVIITEVV